MANRVRTSGIFRSPRHTITRLHSHQNPHRNPPLPSRPAGNLHGSRPSTGVAGALRGGYPTSQENRIGASPSPDSATQETGRLRYPPEDLLADAGRRFVLKPNRTRPTSGRKQGLGEQGDERDQGEGRLMLVTRLGSARKTEGIPFCFTARLTSASSALQTTPMPPSPSFSSIL